MKSGLAFLIAFSVAALSLWLFGHAYNSYGVAVACTLSTMIAYFGWILWCERFRKDYEKYADSVYYLGFMLTLIALLVALWGIGSAETSFVDLVQKFGLGLSTTLLGLVGRIWMLEFGANPEKIDEQVTVQLQESAHELALQLHRGRDVLKSAYDDLAKQVQAQQTEIADLVKGTAGTFAAEIKAISQEIRQSATDSSRELGTVTRNASKEIEDSAKGMAQALKSSADELHGVLSTGMSTIHGSIRGFERAVAAVHIPPDLFEKGLSTALAGANKSFAQLEAAVSAGTAAAMQMEHALKNVNSSAAEATSYFAEVKRAAEALSETGRQITSLNGAITSFDAGIQGAQKFIDEYVAKQITSATQLQGVLADQIKSMKELRTRLEEEVKSSMEASALVHGELKRNAQFIVDKLGT